jgi:peroxiredoxin
MKKITVCVAMFIMTAAIASLFNAASEDHPTLAIGAKAPDFNLRSVNDKTYTLASFASAKVLVVIFTCNHCPTAQCYEDRTIQLVNDYQSKGVAIVAIMPNDDKALRLDELDFSDLGDSFEDMKVRSGEKKFNFPYLYDGETQTVAHAYGPVATPHVFVFDKERKLRYQGRFDDTESPFKTISANDTRDAIESLLQNKEISVKTTKVFGCSVKWSEKREQVQKSLDAWAKEPVKVDSIDEKGIRELLKNNSDKLRLINVWATWCGPCTKEFPDFISINRMYRPRDFEFVSISADNPEKAPQVLKFLVRNQASSKNYHYFGNKYKMMEAIDPQWQGALPYTILVEPGGKIVYAKQGEIDPYQLKKTIVNNHLLGKYP